MVATSLPTSEDVARAVAPIRRHLDVTPVVRAPRLGAGVGLKLEVLQPTGSFKVRGALIAVSHAIEQDRARPVVAASAGNHALGVAHAAQLLGAQATVVVPETASAAKVEALEAFAARLIRHGSTYNEAEQHAVALAAKGAYYISPYNNPHVIAGQGTIGVELLEQLPGLQTIVAPVGGGGLVSGLGLAARLGDGVSVIGVEAASSPAMRAALDNKGIVRISPGETLADGLSGNLEPDSITYDLVSRHVSDVVTVPEPEIAGAIRFLVADHGLVAEGAAATAVAALLSQRIEPRGVTGVVLTGRNIATSTLAALLAT